MKLLQVNTVVNSGSTGRIAEDIGKVLLTNGHESYIAASSTERASTSRVIKVGNEWGKKAHGLKTRLFDRHGFGSAQTTRKFIGELRAVDPDIIHLHNIHGYYLNIKILFDYLKEVQKPVVWTFHDCWPFTGHCSYFDGVNCFKWQTQCEKCPNLKGYPASWLYDQSARNFREKKKIFNGLDNVCIVTPSHWLAEHVRKSFLKNYPVKAIHNGIDLTAFKPSKTGNEAGKKFGLPAGKTILGVANVWDSRKGLSDFFKLRKIISDVYQIVLVGLSQEQIKALPPGISGISRTESVADLAVLYSMASVFVNPTYMDNFPTTNIEALACGTPVITYKTGGSPEAIDEETGMVVEQGDIDGLALAIGHLFQKDKESIEPFCRARAAGNFNKDDRYIDYLRLYENMLAD